MQKASAITFSERFRLTIKSAASLLGIKLELKTLTPCVFGLRKVSLRYSRAR